MVSKVWVLTQRCKELYLEGLRWLPAMVHGEGTGPSHVA